MMKRLLFSLIFLIGLMPSLVEPADRNVLLYNTAQSYEFKLTNSANGQPATTVDRSSITVKYKQTQGSLTTYSTLSTTVGTSTDCDTNATDPPDDLDVCEISDGWYRVILSATVTNYSTRGVPGGYLGIIITAPGVNQIDDLMMVRDSYDWEVDENLRIGVAQAGAASTITLDSGASGTLNFYQFHPIKIIGGIGANQSAWIISYDQTTKIATIDHTWFTNPDSTSIFKIGYEYAPGDFNPTGTVVSSGDCTNATTVFDTTRTDAGTDHWSRAFITFYMDTATASLRGTTRGITASNANGCLTISPALPAIPTAGEKFFIVNQ